jgi:HK97 family phage major capsid protein
MNRKQRKFGDIGRLMRSHRHMGDRGRGLRFNNGGGAGGGGGAAAVLEFSKVEIPETFKLEKPEKDVPEALEKIRHTMVELDKRGGLTAEAFRKVVDDLDVIRAAAMEARNGMRDVLRSVPGRMDEDMPIRAKRIPLSLQVRGEVDLNFQPDFAKLERGGRPGLVQYNLLMRTEKELGITDEGDIAQLRRLKALHDATTMMNLAHARDAAYFASGGHKQLPWWPEQEKLARKFIGALADATAGEGLEWIQVNLLSSTIQELIELETEFSGIFQRFPMRAATMKWPVMAARARAQFIAENIADDGTTSNATIVPDSWTTSDKTYTARKFAGGVVLSSEWEEDAIVNAPLYAQSDLAVQLARGREETIINGQRSGAIDGGSIGATDILNMYDGIRKFFRATGKTAVDLSAGITAEDLAAMIGAQGAAGAKLRDCAWLLGTAGLARMLVAKAGDNSPVFLTVDKVGAQASILTGAVGVVFGRPVYVSQFVSDRMQADGTLDDYTTPTGSKTAIYHIYHRCMKLGQRRGVLIARSDELRFFQDQVVFKGTAREDFQSNVTPSSTQALVMEGNNLAAF